MHHTCCLDSGTVSAHQLDFLSGFLWALKQEDRKEGKGVLAMSLSQGMVGCTGSNPGTYYSDIASVPHNRTLGLLLNLLKHFGGFITDEIKCDSVKICGVINSTDKSSGLLAVTFM